MNNIIGTTLNPVNRLLSCGGSSGGSPYYSSCILAGLVVLMHDAGEGALQALRGSSVGLGTDIGESAIISSPRRKELFSTETVKVAPFGYRQPFVEYTPLNRRINDFRTGMLPIRYLPGSFQAFT